MRLLHVCLPWCQPCTSGVLQGLDVGQCALLLHVRPCEGLVRQVDGSIEKRFSPKHLMYPIQVNAMLRHLSFQRKPPSLPVWLLVAQIWWLRQLWQ